MDGGAVHGVAKSRTRLKRLSSSSSRTVGSSQGSADPQSLPASDLFSVIDWASPVAAVQQRAWMVFLDCQCHVVCCESWEVEGGSCMVVYISRTIQRKQVWQQKGLVGVLIFWGH